MNLNDEVICGYLVSKEQKRANQIFLELLQEFDRLCKKHGIQYYMFFGGLIGAVRHKGFIPWDDDIDVVVSRKDFDRLSRMTQEEFGAEYPYFLQNPTTDPGNVETLIRLRRSDTTAMRKLDWREAGRISSDAPYNMGLCLAIFPLDNVPKSRFAQKLQFSSSKILSAVLYRAYEPPRDKLFRWLLCRIPVSILGYRKFFALRHLPYRLCRRNKSGHVQVLDGFYPGECTRFCAEDFDNVLMLPFEDISVPAPAGYDRILRTNYGDYMQFPPEDRRHPPHGVLTLCDTPYTEAIEKLRCGEISPPEEWHLR